MLLDRSFEGGNLGYRLLKGLQLKYELPVDKGKAAAAVHAHNLAVVSVSLACFNTSFTSAFSMLLMTVLSCLCLSRRNPGKISMIFIGISKGPITLSWRPTN